MARNTSINIRTDSEIKAMAEALYASFGITLSDAINMFLNVSVLEGRMPFELRQPKFNSTTLAAFDEADAIAEGRKSSKEYNSFSELMGDLED